MAFLQKLLIFAWTPTDMPGIDPKVMMHYLKIDLNHRPVKQKEKSIALEWQSRSKGVQKLFWWGHQRHQNKAEASQPSVNWSIIYESICNKVLAHMSPFFSCCLFESFELLFQFCTSQLMLS